MTNTTKLILNDECLILNENKEENNSTFKIQNSKLDWIDYWVSEI